VNITDKWNELERELIKCDHSENAITAFKSVFYGGVVGICSLLENADSREATAKVFDDTKDAIGKYYFEKGQPEIDSGGQG